MTKSTTAIFLSATDHLGASLAGCVELLRIRPLLVGTAWKVLDLLLETALVNGDEVPDRKDGTWTIGRKIRHALNRSACPPNFPPLAWEALLQIYVNTEHLRHSLVHRTAYTDATGALIGIDGAGQQTQPLTAIEQEALGRAVLRAAQLLIADDRDDRVTADLIRQLGQLVEVHGVTQPAVTLIDALPQITIIIDTDLAAPGRYALDVPAVRDRAQETFPGLTYADLILQLRDRPGLELRGRLESAPDVAILFDPASPPIWLS